jgi:hypothetical protein
MSDYGSDQRRCVDSTVAPASAWDADASYFDHLKAEAECLRCPALAACRRQGAGQYGMYGGLIFSGGKQPPASVTDWHSAPAGNVIEKRCESPYCSAIFRATGSNARSQKTCSKRCRLDRKNWRDEQRRAQKAG